MNIVLFGEDIFTAAVLKGLVTDNQQISAVICPFYKENQEYKSLQKAAKENHIPFLRVDDVNAGEMRERLLDLAPDLIITVHLKRILHYSIYSIAEKAAINVHPSLLPKYRGLSPQHQALLNGDKVTGVTIHFIDEKPDTGDVILQEEIPLDSDTSIFELQTKMLSIYKYLVSLAVKKMEANRFTRVRQDEKQASWYGRLKRSDREIDFKKSKSEIYNLIRAVSKPYKGAFHNGVTVWTSFFPERLTEERLMDKYPGAGIYFVEDQVIMRLKDGVLLSPDFEKSEM